MSVDFPFSFYKNDEPLNYEKQILQLKAFNRQQK